MNAKDLKINISATDSAAASFGKLNDRIRQLESTLDRFRQKEERAKEKAKKDKDPTWHDRLKQRFGPQSDLKDIAEIVRGGGALAGLAFAGNTFERITASGADIVGRFQQGQLSPRDMAAELAR